jgi:putative transposase
MSSYHKIYYHVIFGTKNRTHSLIPEKQPDLFKYVWGILKKHDCFLYRVNGIEDHVHIVLDLNPVHSLAKIIKDVKVASSMWVKKSGFFPQFDGWAEGYAAVTFSEKEKEIIVNYVKNQKEHHKKLTFFEEYKNFLIENNIPFEEKYLLK